MYEHALADNLSHAALLDRGRDLDQFYCVEIPVRVGIIYQFKIWQTEPMFMMILVKDNSKFLSLLDKNSKYNMKFYSDDFLYPYQELVTKIRDISLQENGRLRGHYLVSLEIIEEAEDKKIHGLIYAGGYAHSPEMDT